MKNIFKIINLLEDNPKNTLIFIALAFCFNIHFYESTFTNMKMKATYLLLFALLLMNITYGAAQNSFGFDHFWLVLVWPRGYCLDRNCSRSSDIFILHGLWPVTVSGETLISENKSDPNKILQPVLLNPICFFFSCPVKFYFFFTLIWLYPYYCFCSWQKIDLSIKI